MHYEPYSIFYVLSYLAYVDQFVSRTHRTVFSLLVQSGIKLLARQAKLVGIGPITFFFEIPSTQYAYINILSCYDYMYLVTSKGINILHIH